MGLEERGQRQAPESLEETAENLDEQVNHVIKVMSGLRISPVLEEYRLQEIIAEQLERNGVRFQKEYRIAPRSRIDFLVDGGIGIEVKKGKPYRRQVTEQLERYAAHPEIKVMILVVERNLNVPTSVKGKKCILFGLNRLWGVALK